MELKGRIIRAWRGFRWYKLRINRGMGQRVEIRMNRAAAQAFVHGHVEQWDELVKGYAASLHVHGVEAEHIAQAHRLQQVRDATKNMDTNSNK